MTKIIAKVTILIAFIGPATLAAHEASDGPACRIVWISPGGICVWGRVIALADAREVSQIRNLRIGDSWLDEGQFKHLVLEPSLEIAKDFCANAQGHASNIDEGSAKITYKDLQNRVEAIFADSPFATCETQAMELCSAAKAFFVLNERWRFTECAKSQSQGGFCERGSDLLFKENVCNIFGICVPKRQESLKRHERLSRLEMFLVGAFVTGAWVAGTAAAITIYGMPNMGMWYRWQRFPA